MKLATGRWLRTLGAVAVVALSACESDSPEGPDAAAPDLAVADLTLPLDLALPDLSVVNEDLGLDLAVEPDLSALCVANAFLECASGSAVYCDATSTGTVSFACGAGGCLGGGSCGQCTPSTQTCTAGTESSCDVYGRLATRACPLGCDGNACKTCVPGAATCEPGDLLTTCNVDGISTSSRTCAIECAPGVLDADGGAGQAARCKNLVITNRLDSAGAPGLAADCDARSSTFDLVITANATIDPAAGTITGITLPAGVYAAQSQLGSAVMIGRFHVRTLTIDPMVTLTVAADSTHALAFIVDGAVDIAGTLDVAGHLDVAKTAATGGCGVANSGNGVNGTPVTTPPVNNGVGGGGAGHATVGARGGRNGGALGGGGGAYPVANALLVTPLYGGSQGGTSTSAVRSKGGGALQIVSCTSVGVSGLISAGGSGAPRSVTAAFGGGSGGGSGGSVLIEAPSITVTGTVAAAGGGGGGGAVGGTIGITHGAAGADADTTGLCLVGSLGGAGAVTATGTGGLGGNGACGATAATVGSLGVSVTEPIGQGGGGGAGGRIRFNTFTGATIAGGTINPKVDGVTFSEGTLTTQ